jgi:putative ubiquitin-RnfH superfamily antitoxin RatB of RatAB toxin-antitoxin module
VVVTDGLDDVVVLEVVVVVVVNGSCTVAAPAVATSSIAAATNDISLVTCFIGLISNPIDNTIDFRSRCKRKIDSLHKDPG